MKTKKFNQLIFIFLIFGLFLLFFLPPLDPDLGWQLRCGQQIWQEKKICSQNEFSVLLANYRWPHSHSLYQFLIFPFYQIGGLLGLSLINGFLILASIIFFLSLSGQKEVKIVSLPLLIFLSWSVLGFGIRSQLLSFFYFFLLLKLIEIGNGNKISLFFFSPLIMFFWTNSHGGFVLGVFLLLVFLFEKTIWLVWKNQSFKTYFSILGVIFLSLLATLLNPFGFQVYLEAWRHFSVVPLAQLIAEWVPPPPWFQIAICFFLSLAGGVLYQTKKKPLTIFKFLVLIGLAFLAFKARRNLAFFFFFAVYVISAVKIKTEKTKPLALLATMLIFILGFLLQLPKTLMIDTNWQRFCQAGRTKFASQAIEFLKQQEEKGNIFNIYEQGGFLIWQLPEYKVFIDGRMPAWPTPSGKSPYTIHLETLQTQPGWQEALEKYEINWLLIGPGTFMDLKIKDNPESFGWQEVYRDKIAVIYKRK